MTEKVMKKEIIEKIYAGWLAKTIGIRLGAPIEGWTYQRIKDVFGELHDFPGEVARFAADDDSNGPIFLIRALEDSKNGYDISAQDVGEALLNYAPFETGFFWWGGYGTSTEHTAYLNLRAGIKAPASGSIAQNGAAVAEQIGGQIFIDTWGLVTPGNTDLAADYARKAASVTHDGNGIYGGIFVAVCISHAFVEQDIHAIIEKGLSYIPADCEYSRVVCEVMDFHEKYPENWRECFQFIYKNFGYDKYPGICHIIPNAAVMVLALLYGKGDFSATLNICNMCGWDTDCNVGNIATIIGVRNGLEGIDYDKWRKEINDVLICSSVVGSLNIMDIPYGAAYLVRLAAGIAGEDMPEPWNEILGRRLDGCHFEFPGSTQGMRVRTEYGSASTIALVNTEEAAHTGNRSLSVSVSDIQSGRVLLYRKTYYVPDDFEYGRYDPSFSPTVYPGQTLTGGLYLPKDGCKCKVRGYVHDKITDRIITCDEGTVLNPCQWTAITMKIPAMEGGLIDEVGFAIDLLANQGDFLNLRVLLDDFYWEGEPDYTVDFSKAYEEVWNPMRKEISQFTKLKGITYLEDGKLHLSCSDFGEIYTGGYDWKNYQASFVLTPALGKWHMCNVRVQGAIRSYAAGFSGEGKLGIYKNENGYRKLKEMDYPWEYGKTYKITVKARENNIYVAVDGEEKLVFTDEEYPYLQGGIGMSVREGSHSLYESIAVKPLQ